MNPGKQILCSNCGKAFQSSKHGSFRCPACVGPVSNRKTKSTLTSDVGAADECLRMVKFKLEECGIQMDACPPMFYAEAIHNLFSWTALAARDCCALHGWHDKDEIKVVQCIKEWIARHQVENELAGSHNQ